MAAWRQNSRGGANQNCAEVARNLPGIVAMRDNKDRQGPELAFTPADWRRFTAQIKAGSCDAA